MYIQLEAAKVLKMLLWCIQWQVTTKEHAHLFSRFPFLFLVTSFYVFLNCVLQKAHLFSYLLSTGTVILYCFNASFGK